MYLSQVNKERPRALSCFHQFHYALQHLQWLKTKTTVEKVRLLYGINPSLCGHTGKLYVTLIVTSRPITHIFIMETLQTRLIFFPG